MIYLQTDEIHSNKAITIVNRCIIIQNIEHTQVDVAVAKNDKNKKYCIDNLNSINSM